MKDFIQYKDYIGSVHFNADDEVFFGKIEGIEDLVSFEGSSVDELKKAFIDSVEDYIVLCKEIGKKNEKSYKGSFNVRIAPEIHKKAKRLAIMKGISLNQFIQKAVEEEVNRESIHI
ncbi:MAG TPA: type II toxin-antitoxin system HicB family antitoxin [Treponema sp.]|nr:type II toxin-antitoxin system HicB family antitoxin [Treponema sp.]